MKSLKKILFCLLLMLGIAALANAEDILYLTNGSVYHGKVLGTLPDGAVKFKKKDGAVVVYKKAHVKKIEHIGSESHAAAEKPAKHEHHHVVEASGTTNGVNNIGRPGYFFSDTAFVPNKSQAMGTAGVEFFSPGSQIYIPVGGAYGITDQFQIHANTSFYAFSGASGFNFLTVGGKYKFDVKVERLLIAAGLDLSDGPLTGPLSTINSFNFDPYGIVTYTFVDGFQLNGQLGVEVPVGGTKVGNITITPPAYVQLNAGASYPIADQLTGIAELDINGQGSGATPLIAGIRTGHDVQLQVFAGLDLAGTVGVMLGGNVALVSE